MTNPDVNIFSINDILHTYETYDTSEEVKESILYFVSDLTGLSTDEILARIKNPSQQTTTADTNITAISGQRYCPFHDTIVFPLNNDMTQVIEHTDKGLNTFTVMGTGRDTEWSNMVGEETLISEQDMFNFIQSQKLK